MKAIELLTSLRQSGVKVWIDGDHLRYRAPEGVLTASTRSQLAEHKREIMALLRYGDRPDGHHQPLRRISREGKLPLSPIQERMWFIDQIEPGNPAYNIPSAFHIEGPFDPNVLERSLNEILRRHEILRATCATADGKPYMVIAQELRLPLVVVDLRELANVERDAKVRQLTTEEARRPFDLTRGPMLRAIVLWLDEEAYVLLLTTHHFVADGWSMGVFTRELSSHYESFQAGTSSPLPELSIQYVDFTHWQQQQLQGYKLDTQLAYWKQQLADAPAVLELPTDYPRPPVFSYHGSTQSFTLPKRLSQALAMLSRQEGVTLFMTLMAGIQVLLHRYTSQEDIVVGTAVSNRNRIEAEGLIGSFSNNLVLRTDLSGNPTFRELLQRIREVCLAAYVHQDLPFEKLVEELQPERDLSRNPLFQVMFVLHQHAPEHNLKLPGLTLRKLPIETGSASFDLSLEIVDANKNLFGTLEYNTDLFEKTTIKRMSGHFQILMEAIVTNANQRISDLPMLTEAEQHQILVEWNETSRDIPPDVCLHHLFEAQVAQKPETVAVIFEDQQLTYRELDIRANQLAHYLRKLGVGPEVLVGLYVERSLEMIVGLLGILKAGGAYIPMDPTNPPERLAFILDETQTPVLVTQSSLGIQLPTYHGKTVCLDTQWEMIVRERISQPNGGAKSENLAYVIYTSGSTGKPKGVMITHSALCNRFLWGQQIYLRSESDRVLQHAALSSDYSVWEIFIAFVSGAGLVVANPGKHFDSEYLVRLMADQGVTIAGFVPSQLSMLLEVEYIAKCQSLRQVFSGGEVLTSELLERYYGQIPAILINTYGPTEATIDVTHWMCERHEHHQTIPIGRPIGNTQLYILNQAFQPVPVGVPGELYIAGVQIARGYLNQPGLTAEKFLPNPFSKKVGAKLYRTGDLVRWLPDGTIEFLGRIDHQVKIRGFRIELGEIEVVLGQYPAVRKAVVVAREDSPGDKRLVAYVVSDAEHAPPNSELRRFLKGKLPEYMIPSAFVQVDALPLTSSGKVDRQSLPVPDRTRPDLEKSFVAPRSSGEEILAEIWTQVLGIERIGVHDNFFDLGGHSLLATRIVSRIRDVLHTELPLRSLFEAPTVSQLAAVTEKMKKKSVGFARSPIVPVSREKYRKKKSPGGKLSK